MKLEGVIIPIATPLKDDDELDESGLSRLANYLIDAGVSSLFALGSTGEFALLRWETQEAVVSHLMRIVAGRLPVLVGASAPGTRLAIDKARMAQRYGAGGVIVTAGFYYPQTDNELETHLRAVASSVDIPVVLYNIPQRVGRYIPLDMIGRLLSDGLIAAIKDSSGNMKYLTGLLELKERYPGFSVLQGDEYLLAAALVAGADGIVPGIGNLAAKRCVDLYESAKRGDFAKAFQHQAMIAKLNRVFEQGSPYGGLKEALSQLGLCRSQPAMGAELPTEQGKKIIADLISQAGIAASR